MFWVLFTEAVGFLSGLLTREGTAIYASTMLKPPLSPPGWVFPVVWAILYALMGFSMARVALATEKNVGMKNTYLYLAQLGFNFFWSIIFFNFQAYGIAFIWLVILWVLILLMVLSFRKASPLAAYLQIPYLLWVAFAGYLNAGVWLLNK